MSEDGDKTEEPTEHKLQEARKKGQVFKSQEIVSTCMLFVTAGVLMSAGGWMFGELANFARLQWTDLIGNSNFEGRDMQMDFLWMVIAFLKVLTPLLAGAFVVAILANIAQIKFLFSTESIQPKLSKINPIEGFKRIFSAKSLMELAKQIAKLTIIGWIVYKVVGAAIPKLTSLVQTDINMTVMLTREICVEIIKKVMVGMLVIGIVDYIFQKKQYMKQMKMSMQELKDEYKDTEGNPQVKGKMRQLMRQASQGRMMEGAAGANAVVTNPTHLAVAIKYEQGVDAAPTVVAKGERMVAVQIKLVAEENDVPIIENVELARAVFTACEVGQAIPPELYKGVAEVLAYIYKLKKKRMQRKRKAAQQRRRMQGRAS
ncbi:MAG: flagellar biosynthesis protein FlhB [Armatimonadetes bacterium]|nr:flagellar biosynthesis protein FlhB [Armatimonadota bacterium]